MHNFSTDQPRRNQRYILIGALAVVIIVGAKAAFGTAGALSFGTVSTALYLGYTRYIWRWDVLHENDIVKVPDLNGTWKGHLYTSTAREKIPESLVIEDGRQIDGFTKMETSIKIKQRWDKIEVTLTGPESSSYSRAATILVEEKAWPTLSYNYFNEGSNVNDDPDPHYGSALLEYSAAQNKLEGRYFNRPDQRATHGILELYRTND